MLALTVRQPWAHLIARRGKWVENRTWRPSAAAIGERIAIHAGAARPMPYHSLELLVGGEVMSLPAIMPDVPPPQCLEYGAVIATARLAGWVEELPRAHACGPRVGVRARYGVSKVRAEEALASEWWIGPIGWVLEDVVPIAPPSSCRGMLGLWELGRCTAREVKLREENAREEADHE